MEVKIPKCGRNVENAERYRNKRDGTWLQLMCCALPGNRVSRISDGAGRNLEKEWNEGVRKDYQIPV